MLKTIESQTYICRDVDGFKFLLAEAQALHERFDSYLPKDSQGLVVPDPKLDSRLLGRQKALWKVTAARNALLKAKMNRAGLKDLPLYAKHGRQKLHSKLRRNRGQRKLTVSWEAKDRDRQVHEISHPWQWCESFLFHKRTTPSTKSLPGARH